jgi:glycosyltransferase involved in cell wall biosynthesis
MVSPSSLGVVIPCHKPYIPYLRECLDSIESQTVKPNEVVVVCSSSQSEDIPASYKDYSFPLTIVTREDERNQAQNRNQGADVIGTEFVSFFDADDIMHPQRLEIVRKFVTDVDILLHAYQMETQSFPVVEVPTVTINQLIRSPTGCAVFVPNWNAPIHHSQVTVRAAVLDRIRFREEPDIKRREDSLFCGDILAMEGVRSAYVADSLSWYRLTH